MAGAAGLWEWLARLSRWVQWHGCRLQPRKVFCGPLLGLGFPTRPTIPHKQRQALSPRVQAQLLTPHDATEAALRARNSSPSASSYDPIIIRIEFSPRALTI